MNNVKNENGITLITLVVTIVVMLILASIVISTSVGDNGLIKQAEESTIKASIREVEEALDAYILLKEKEAIKNGDLSDITLDKIAEDEDDNTPEERDKKLLSMVDNTTEEGYNVYIIKDISKINVKGKYGKGNTTDVFKVKEKDGTYEVYYIASDGTTYKNEN